MKKILLLLLLLPTILLSQTRQFRPDKQTYIEAITGIGIVGDWDISNRPFTSLSIGRTVDFGDYSLMDISVGLSYPMIASAKFGLGSYYGKKENTSIVLGIRVRPITAYSQVRTKIKDKGFLTVSVEWGTGGDRVVGYTNLFNIGWYWPLKFKKKK